MNQKLEKFLAKKQKQSSKASTINWDERRDNYLAAVESLYRRIESMLGEAIQKKSVTVQRHPKHLTENYIGTYQADDLTLVIGDEQVRFSPRGRNIVGATGRVDILGERGETILIHQADSSWAFVRSRQPKLETVPFDESTLAEVLQLVMRD